VPHPTVMLGEHSAQLTPTVIHPVLGLISVGEKWFDDDVSSIRSFVYYWVPVLIMMALIFSASTDVMSEHRTSRFIVPFLHWLLPGLSEQTIGSIHYAIRKSGHVTEYGILGILFWRALRKPRWRDPRPWSWAEAGWAILLCAGYAGTDEFHQSFVPSRWASGWDVVIDTVGAGLGVLFCRGVAELRRQWQ
jgi:VanZ family protein